MNSTASAGIDADHVFAALSHQHRRIALACLIERDEQIPLNELAEHVAMEVEPTGNIQNGQLFERLSIRLHHSHLPKLAALGLVEYNQEAPRMVSVTSTGHDLEAFLTHEVISGL